MVLRNIDGAVVADFSITETNGVIPPRIFLLPHGSLAGTKRLVLRGHVIDVKHAFFDLHRVGLHGDHALYESRKAALRKGEGDDLAPARLAEVNQLVGGKRKAKIKRRFRDENEIAVDESRVH